MEAVTRHAKIKTPQSNRDLKIFHSPQASAWGHRAHVKMRNRFNGFRVAHSLVAKPLKRFTDVEVTAHPQAKA